MPGALRVRERKTRILWKKEHKTRTVSEHGHEDDVRKLWPRNGADLMPPVPQAITRVIFFWL